MKTKALTIIMMLIVIMAAEICLLPAPRASPVIPENGVKGIASFYSYECADLPMANGRPFDPEKRTCASWFYKFGTVLEVKSLDTGRATEVVVTDRGPNKRLVKEGRIIDLSERAFRDICDTKHGLAGVLITVKSKET